MRLGRIVSTRPGLRLSDGRPLLGQQPELLVASRHAMASGQLDLARSLRQQWMAIEETVDDRVDVALAGRVPVAIDPTSAPIRAGDLLTSWLAHDYLHIRQVLRLRHNYLMHASKEDLRYAGEW